jgi:hypothetical protein
VMDEAPIAVFILDPHLVTSKRSLAYLTYCRAPFLGAEKDHEISAISPHSISLLHPHFTSQPVVAPS